MSTDSGGGRSPRKSLGTSAAEGRAVENNVLKRQRRGMSVWKVLNLWLQQLPVTGKRNSESRDHKKKEVFDGRRLIGPKTPIKAVVFTLR